MGMKRREDVGANKTCVETESFKLLENVSETNGRTEIIRRHQYHRKETQ